MAFARPKLNRILAAATALAMTSWAGQGPALAGGTPSTAPGTSAGTWFTNDPIATFNGAIYAPTANVNLTFNPLVPAYAGDRGLLGGHFDTDVHKVVSGKWKRVQHVHEYDDKYDNTYVDLLKGTVQDPPSGTDTSITMGGQGVPSGTPLRIVFRNTANVSGSYSLTTTDGQTFSGKTHDAVFDKTVSSLSAISNFKLSFTTLGAFAKTTPGDVSADTTPFAAPNRKGAMTVDVYANGNIAYQLCVYWHYKGDVNETAPTTAPSGPTNLTVSGNLLPGVDGQVNEQGTVSLVGATAPRSEAVTLPLITVPTAPVSLGAYTVTDGQTKTISSGMYGMSSLRLSGSGVLNITGNVTLVIDGALSIIDTAGIVLAPGASLTIIGAPAGITLLGKGISNKGLPQNLQIYCTADTSTNPEAEINVVTDGGFFGSAVGGKVEASGPAIAFHFDKGLGNVEAPTAPNYQPKGLVEIPPTN